MKLFIFVSLVFSLAGCSDDSYVSTVKYKIEHESVHPTFSKSTLDIRLDKKISEKDLQET
jgi:lipoprotein NlpI